jgi:hypothetical protein
MKPGRLLARWLPIAIAFLLIIAAGVANGLWVDRWVISHELAQMTERIQKVPMTMGSWVGKDDDRNQQLAQRLIDEGVLHALVSREYTNTQTGQKVALLMATGRPGPISTHNPLTCYNASGFTDTSRVESSTITPPGGKTSAEFSRCGFGRDRASGGKESLTVYWAWKSPEGWIAASDSDPRGRFLRYRALTKIYVIQSDAGGLPGLVRDEPDPATRFIQDSLPIIDATLFGNPSTTQEPAATPASPSSAPAIGG